MSEAALRLAIGKAFDESVSATFAERVDAVVQLYEGAMSEEPKKDLADRLYDVIRRIDPLMTPSLAWKLVAAIVVEVAIEHGVDLT